MRSFITNAAPLLCAKMQGGEMQMQSGRVGVGVV